jgi:lysophospholipase L1-like esterase
LRIRELAASAALAVASLVTFVGLLEIGVRLFVPAERWRFLDSATDWKLDPKLGWAHRPDIDVTSRVGGEQPIRFRTSHDGLIPASATPERRPGTLRIMVFGDSMVVGRILPQETIYTARLEAILNERGLRAEVINAGVQGYSTDQALLAMERWVPVYRPDVVLYGSTFNDFGGNALDHAYEQAKPRFVLEGPGRLRLQLPQLASEVHRLGGGFAAVIQYSALYRLLQPRIYQLRASPTAVTSRVLLGLYDDAFVRPRVADSLDWRLYAALVARMRDTARSAGARFAFFAHPEIGEVWDPYIEIVCASLAVPRERYDPYTMERRLTALAAHEEIEFIPLVDEFRSRQQEGPFHLVPGDQHLNTTGHELLARTLAARLLADRADAALAHHPTPEHRPSRALD